MGSVIDLNVHRRSTRSFPRSSAGQTVTCLHCGESHPIVRLAGGEERCLTAFLDGKNWFCRNRGCRRSWLESRAKR
jgi:hypothetical protein